MEKRDAKADLALLKAATPGPWWWRRKGHLCEMSDVFSGVDSGYDQWFNSPSDEDAAFIAACPEMVEHWINRAVEVEKVLRDAMEALEEVERCEFVRRCSTDSAYMPVPIGHFELVVSKTRKALAKAKEVLS
jgi:hypothetical protein